MDYQFVPVLAVGFALSLSLTPVSRQVAMRLGVVDTPKKRNITKSPTPMMGGMAIVLSFVIAIILFTRADYTTEVGAVVVCTILLSVVGLLDDRFTLGIKIRLVFMAIAAGILISAGIHIRLFKTPLLDYPVTVFWVLAIMNAVNFLDNMDGLASGLSAIAAGFFLLIGIVEGLPLVTILAAALLGSAAGFLAFNFNPASSFMGDMGALTLGVVLATLGIVVRFNSHPVGVSWMIPVLVLALPVFDINLVILTRLMEGRSPGQAGKDHTSHRLMSLGLSQRGALLVLYAACGFFGLIGLAMGSLATREAWIVGIFSIGLLGVLFLTMIGIRRKFQL